MQPYLFPYIGYFALAAAVNRFVFYDDVAYMRSGWINRNRWMLDGRVAYFTVPLRDASSFRPIREVHVDGRGPWRRKLLATMHQHYQRAPHFDAIAPLVESVIVLADDRIGEMAKASVRTCCHYLGLEVEFIDSSTGYGNAALRGSARVLDICRIEAADEYVNLPSGRSLYDPDAFARRGLALSFVDPVALTYAQPAPGFVPNLSIIDVLMYAPRDAVRRVLLG